ncbi:MAG: DUF4159 domain-containing protein [Bacteroidales bacterium]|nr:DUF4159 domain-containing protein [Bacteroidales bacterium]
MRIIKVAISFIIIIILSSSSVSNLQIALLKYNGGGDWYANPTSLPNLVKFCNKNIGTTINPEIATIDVGSKQILNYPLLHLTGHGNIIFTPQEAENLRKYLISGGFLHISDNYGLDKFIRPQMKKVFPELEFIELPFSHKIYHQKYNFNNGLPKIHEHEDSTPKGLGLIYQGRLVCFYDFECDLGDGWEDADVHNDSKEKRTQALQMGANIVSYIFLN